MKIYRKYLFSVFSSSIFMVSASCYASEIELTTAEISSYLDKKTAYLLPDLARGKMALSVPVTEKLLQYTTNQSFECDPKNRHLTWGYGFAYPAFSVALQSFDNSSIAGGKSTLFGEFKSNIARLGMNRIRTQGVIKYEFYAANNFLFTDCKTNRIGLDAVVDQSMPIEHRIGMNLNPSFVPGSLSGTGRPQVAFKIFYSHAVYTRRLYNHYVYDGMLAGERITGAFSFSNNGDQLSNIENELSGIIKEEWRRYLQDHPYVVASFTDSVEDEVEEQTNKLFGDLVKDFLKSLGGVLGADKITEQGVRDNVIAVITADVPRAIFGAYQKAVVMAITPYRMTSEEDPEYNAEVTSVPNAINLPVASQISDSLLKKVFSTVGAGTMLCGSAKNNREKVMYAMVSGDVTQRDIMISNEKGCMSAAMVGVLSVI